MLYPGILARRAEDLAPVLRIIAGPDGQDEFATDSTVGDPATVDVTGLPVVVSTHSSTFPLRPALREAIERAGAALAERGAKVREEPMRQMRWAFAQFGATALAEIDLLNSWEGIIAPTGKRAHRKPPLVVRGPAAVLKLIEAAPVRAVRSKAAGRLIDAARRAQDSIVETIGDGVLLYPPFPRAAPAAPHDRGPTVAGDQHRDLQPLRHAGDAGAARPGRVRPADGPAGRRPLGARPRGDRGGPRARARLRRLGRPGRALIAGRRAGVRLGPCGRAGAPAQARQRSGTPTTNAPVASSSR